MNHLARTENKSQLDILNHKIEQLQKAKASYKRQEKSKESHNIDKMLELSNTESNLSHSNKSLRIMHFEQVIPRKKITKNQNKTKKKKVSP